MMKSNRPPGFSSSHFGGAIQQSVMAGHDGLLDGTAKMRLLRASESA
jgi:hypothetical protein